MITFPTINKPVVVKQDVLSSVKKGGAEKIEDSTAKDLMHLQSLQLHNNLVQRQLQPALELAMLREMEVFKPTMLAVEDFMFVTPTVRSEPSIEWYTIWQRQEIGKYLGIDVSQMTIDGIKKLLVKKVYYE